MAADSGNDDSWNEIKNKVSPLKKKPKLPSAKKTTTNRLLPVKKSQEESLLFKWEIERKDAPQPVQGFSKKEHRKIGKEVRALPYIDLHGKTIDAAFTALEKFIRKKFVEGERAVIVITGKGKGEVSIASNLGGWLRHSELAKFVISYDNAPREAGGSGAWILKLRKHK